MKLRIYISAPITGFDLEERKKTFAEAAEKIELFGHVAVNPMALDHSKHDQTWESFMKVDIAEMVKCDRIFFMQKGTDQRQRLQSRGLRIEAVLSGELGIEQLQYISDLGAIPPEE